MASLPFRPPGLAPLASGHVWCGWPLICLALLFLLSLVSCPCRPAELFCMSTVVCPCPLLPPALIARPTGGSGGSGWPSSSILACVLLTVRADLLCSVCGLLVPSGDRDLLYMYGVPVSIVTYPLSSKAFLREMKPGARLQLVAHALATTTAPSHTSASNGVTIMGARLHPTPHPARATPLRTRNNSPQERRHVPCPQYIYHTFVPCGHSTNVQAVLRLCLSCKSSIRLPRAATSSLSPRPHCGGLAAS